MRTAESIDTTLVYVVHRKLPPRLRPCFVHRHEGVAVVFTDPRTTRLDLVAWTIDNLTVPERNYLRATHGQPPVGEPFTDDFLEGLTRPSPLVLVPDAPQPSPDLLARAWQSRHALHVESDEILRRAM